MKRLVWSVGVTVLAGCAEPRVLLDEEPFAFQSAAAIPFEYETTLGPHRATMLMVANRPRVCDSLQDLTNYCNFRLFPDVAALGVWSMARPVGARGPTLLALLKDTDVGEVDTLRRVEDPSDYGLTLVEEDGSRVRTTEYRAWIDRLEPGRTLAVSFNGTLGDGRFVRGAVEAEWCDGLLLATRNDLIDVVKLQGMSSGRVEGGALVELNRVDGCFDVTIDTRCTSAPQDTQASCECHDTQGRSATFAVPRGAFERFEAECPFRFGEPAP